jgi:hypothetical protein
VLRCALVAVLVVGSFPTSADTGTGRIRIYDGLVSLEIPNDWHEISAADLEETTYRTAEATSGRLVEVYQHGFRPVESSGDPGLPQILVQIREGGRIRTGDLMGHLGLTEFLDGAAGSLHEALPPLVMELDIERIRFDPETLTLHIEHGLSLRFKGAVQVLTTAFLTERGLVAFHFSDRKSRIGDSRALFDTMMRSVRIDQKIAYRRRWSDRWPGAPFFVAAGIAAAILAVIVLRRRRAAS